MLTNSAPIIGVLVGSTRQGSFNQQLADRLPELSPVELRQIRGLDALPFFSEELEADTPAAVAQLRAAISEVDALVIVSPEYNASLPGMLKNAIDWVSRPYDSSVLANKPVTVIGASPSPGGAAGAVKDTVKILTRAKAAPLEATVTVPRAYQALAGPLDDDLTTRLTAVLDELAETARGDVAAA